MSTCYTESCFLPALPARPIMCAAAACYSSAATDIPSRHPLTVQPVSLELPNLTSTAARTALAREFVVYTAAPSSLALSLSSSGIALRSSSSASRREPASGDWCASGTPGARISNDILSRSPTAALAGCTYLRIARPLHPCAPALSTPLCSCSIPGPWSHVAP